MQECIKKCRFGDDNIDHFNEMENIMKIVKSLEESDSLIKGASERIENGAKVHLKRKGFVGMLSGTLGAKLLGNLLPDKDVI